jgi:hypothetical protein
MRLRTSERYLYPIRHPERSAEDDFLFPKGARPRAVEGPSQFKPEVAATDSFLFVRCPFRRFSLARSSLMAAPITKPRRSFDFGSTGPFCQIHPPLAFAQDDGSLRREPSANSRMLRTNKE